MLKFTSNRTYGKMGWFCDFCEIKKGFFVPGGIYAQAKEIEKEHIINAANITMEQRLLVDPIYKDCGEQYYNETYKL